MIATRWKRLLRLGLSLAVLAMLLQYVGASSVAEQLLSMDIRLVTLAFVLVIGDSLARCFNWWQLSRQAECPVSLRDTAYAYFVGGFVGSHLPSTLSTDAARSAIAAARSGGRIEVLLATMVSLNLLSLAAIAALALAACIFLFAEQRDPGSTLIASLVISVACLGCIATLAVVSRWHRTRATLADGDRTAGLIGRARAIMSRFAAALLVLSGVGSLSRIAAVAVASYALRTAGWFVLIGAAGASVPWVGLLVLGPLATFGAALPISIGGFGGQQAIGVYLLADWGVSPGQALAVSLIQSSLYVLLQGIGCALYVATGAARERQGTADGRLPTDP